MTRYLLLLVFMVIVNINVNLSDLLPKPILAITVNEGFLSFIVPKSPSFGQFKSCQVKIGETAVDLNDNEDHVFDGTVFHRFSSKYCGVRAKNVQSKFGGNWTFTALDDEGHEAKEVLELTVLPIKNRVKEFNITVSPGTEVVRVPCPDSDGSRHCQMIDHEGTVYDRCEISIYLKSKIETVICRVLFWGNMHESETLINIIKPDKDKDVITTLSETETHILATCQTQRKLSQCRAVSETMNKTYLLMDGLLTEHYSAYDTNTVEGRCSFEIEKPLKDEDKGVWRIYQDYDVNSYKGCVFDLGAKRTKRSAKAEAKKIEVVHDFTTKGTETIIKCEASYEIEYCYLQGPSEASNQYASVDFERLKYLGQCLFKVQNITSGTWACGVNDNKGNEDHLTYYDVTVYDKPAKAITPEIKGSVGEAKPKLLCKTMFDKPIKYCRFTTANGDIHGLSEETIATSSSRLKYFGEGLLAGECGVEIEKLQSNDFGEWTCSFKVSNQEYSIKMMVQEEAMSTASIVGLSVGLCVLIAFAGGFFAYRRFYKRRIYEGPRMSLSISQGSHES